MFEPPRDAGVPPDRLAESGVPTMRAQSPDDHSLPMARLPETRAASPDVSPPLLSAPGPAPLRDAPASAGLGPAESVQQQALQATVRLCVSDATGRSHGTGTIIDVHGDEALVLTCGHIFRQSRGQGEISVELCVPGARSPVRGELLAYDADQRDVGLVTIRPGVAVHPVRVASTDFHPQPGDPVFSVGCDHGARPTVRESTISAINRYVSRGPHVEVLGHPVEGRSGGGLFAADGRLIGVCNAADLRENRGIYAALPAIHQELKAINQERIYAADPTLTAAAVEPRREVAPAVTSAPLRSSAAAAPHTLPAAGSTEVICVVRSRRDDAHDERVVVINQPSAALLQLLQQEAQGTSGTPASPPPPVLRAQNY
jgi:hypothetical protein